MKTYSEFLEGRQEQIDTVRNLAFRLMYGEKLTPDDIHKMSVDDLINRIHNHNLGNSDTLLKLGREVGKDKKLASLHRFAAMVKQFVSSNGRLDQMGES